ncbi:hypothetical protein RJ55_06511 [Drechmeria coniospora]|nr:hypothetical protein RJ55_06511 [Drechmeria coniospora]
MDATAWPDGWIACHDEGVVESRGDSMKAMFRAVADQRRAGKNMIFVWLDIKNADRYSPTDSSNGDSTILALRQLAREILEPAQVRVLYGFQYPGGVAYDLIRAGLDDNEAINLNGNATVVNHRFETHGHVDIKQRIMSYGWSDLPFEFGNCFEHAYFTCTELRQAEESKRFGQVYGWTLDAGQEEYAKHMLGDANVDGIIYGFRQTHYYDHEDTRSAIRDITRWLENNPARRYLATARDMPW